MSTVLTSRFLVLGVLSLHTARPMDHEFHASRHAQRHGPDRGHSAIAHDDHVDHLRDGRLHPPHDDRGAVDVVAA